MRRPFTSKCHVSPARMAAAVVACAAFLYLAPSPAFAQAATFHGVGDVPGGATMSVIRDATRVGNVIYAVGGSAANNQVECSGPNNPPGCVFDFTSDTAVLWTWDGVTGVLTPLPNLATPTTPGVNGIPATAITRDGAYIVGQARSNVANAGEVVAVRVTRNGLANLRLTAAPFPTFNPPSIAQAISDNGSIVYGFIGSMVRAVRFDVSTSSSVLIPLLPTFTANSPAPRATSSDGSVMVGTSFIAPFTGTNGRAFRYVHANPVGTVTAIPLLPGGTWNKSIALTPDGRTVLVGGNSSAYPNGEVYLYDAVTGAITPLGSPNSPWGPTNLGGITADGAVVTATFGDPSGNSGAQHAYVHNGHGWFHLSTVVNALGVDLFAQGWDTGRMDVTGISPDGTLVFGSSKRQNDDVEGFVAEFAPGALAAFDYPAVPPLNQLIVGAWGGDGDPSLLAFTGDGTYFHIQTRPGTQTSGENVSGFERGLYRWDPVTDVLSFATLVDTNGNIGFSGGNGVPGFPLEVTATDAIVGGQLVGHRIDGGTPDSVVGAWMIGDPSVQDDLSLMVLRPDGTFALVTDLDNRIDPDAHDGIEVGTYSWTPGTLTITATLDTNGEFGLGTIGASNPIPMRLVDGGLHLQLDDDGLLTRLVDPHLVVPVITSALTASAQVGMPFSYATTAAWAATFAASGLPGGLSIDGSTGRISGTPTQSGDFNVTITATNIFNDSSSAALSISVAPGVEVTSLVAAPAAGIFGGTTTFSATLTSAGAPFAGQPIVFSRNGTAVGTATTDGSGVAVLQNVSLAGLTAGTYATGIQASYAGDAAHAPSSATAALVVSRATPVITWATPAPIFHNVAISAVQLNATANVPGTFAYLPNVGAFLPLGTQTLATTFTPTDQVNYTTATAQVSITVLNAPPNARNVVVLTQEGVAKNGTLFGIDFESDPMTFSITTPPTKGTVTLLDASTGAFTYTPNGSAIGYDSFVFSVGNASGMTSANGAVLIVANTPRWPGQIARVSVGPGGIQANGSSLLGGLASADGRYIAFNSEATNLVPGAAVGTYVYDRITGTTKPVNVASDGTPGNGFSVLTDITPDGRYVAFTSEATNLVPDDTNGQVDAFVHDMVTGQTERVSIATDGTQGNNESVLPVISADGRFVAFYGRASNLVPGDVNNSEDVFLRDRLTGQTTLVSVSSTGVRGNSNSWRPTITPDGRYIAFNSEATNIVAGDSNGVIDNFVRDLWTGQTTRETVNGSGGQLTGGDSSEGQLSADARYYVFTSEATNVVPGDTNGRADVFLRDRQTGVVTRVSVSGSGVQGNNKSEYGTISADGRFVSFRSLATNLVPGDTNNAGDVFVYDRQTAQLTRISVANDGTEADAASFGTDEGFSRPVISADGRFVVFPSAASNLVAGDTNAVQDLFVAGGVSVEPTAINVPGSTVTRTVNVSVAYPDGPWTASTTTPWITIDAPAGGSGNGTQSFTVAANPGSSPRTGSLTVALQTITVVQGPSTAPVAANGVLSTPEDTSVSGTLSATDPEGDPIAFSLASQPAHGSVTLTNAATGAFTYTPAPNYNGPDSFTFQAIAGGEVSSIATVSVTVTPVNDPPVASNGVLAALEDVAAGATLSAADIDGNPLTFSIVSQPAHGAVEITNASTGAYTYTPAANYNGPDSFTFRATDGSLVSNIATVTITVAPVNDAPVANPVVMSTQQGIVRSGTLLATDLEGDALTFSIVSAPTKGVAAITDAATGTFSYTPNAGAIGYDTFTFRATDASGASSTATGMAFIVASSPRWPGQTIRANVSSTGAQQNATSWDGFRVRFSTDGRFVAFDSLGSNLVGGDTNNVGDVFIRDRQTGITSRVSVTAAGVQGNDHSLDPAISADGRFVAFTSLASNLVPGDTNGFSDVFVFDRQTSQLVRASVDSTGAQGSLGGSTPAISADGRFVAFTSGSALVPGDANGQGDVYVRDLVLGQTTLISVATDGTASNGFSGDPVISADGRFVAFRSGATTLVSGDTNGTQDVFLHDRLTHETTRVSVSSDGMQADAFSDLPGISADGRFVVFHSSATNLVASDTNGLSDVFLFDRETRQTTRVSITEDGLQANNSSDGAVVSADGRFIAFRSSATNLVPGDTNNSGDVFVRDRQTARTTRVHLASDGSQANSSVLTTAMSDDGQYIGFMSFATNLVAGDTDNTLDAFVVGGVTVSPSTVTVPQGGGASSVNVSFGYPGTTWAATTSTPWITINPPTGGSANGTVSFTVAPNPGAARTGTVTVALQTVTVNQAAATTPVALNFVFQTDEDTLFSDNLPASDPNGDPLTFSIVTQPVRGSVVLTNPSTGAFTYTPQLNRFGGDTLTFQVTANGEVSNVATVNVTVNPVNDAPVAFDSSVDAVEDTPLTGGLVASDPDSLVVQFVLVSPASHGTVAIPGGSRSPLGGSFTYTPAPNYNGPDSFTYVVVDGALQSNVATVSITVATVSDSPVAADVFLLTPEGVAQNGSLLLSNVDGRSLTYTVVTSPTLGVLTVTNPVTGAFTYTPNRGAFGYDTFSVSASDGLGGTAVSSGQVFIVANGPRWPGQTTSVSVASTGAGSNNTSSLPAISGDGRYIVFYSLGTNLVPGDTNGVADVFVRDRLTSTTTRVSVSSAGAQGNGDSSGQAISADGRYVAFTSVASNLVAGDTNGASDVFVRDLQTGQTTRVSVPTGGGQSNGSSGNPAVSGDGRYVAFSSAATNLVSGDTNGVTDVFVHDRQTGQTSRISVSSAGAQGNGSSLVPSFSGNGRYVSFESSASNLVPGDTNANPDTFVRDLLTGQTTRVSVATGGGQGNDRSSGGLLSADGRFVVFRSFASSLAGGPTSNIRGDIFVHDRQTGVTTRVDVADDGSEALVGASSWFSISGDGRFVAFASFATNLVPGDTNATGDIFVRDRQTNRTTRVSVNSGGGQLFGASDVPAISADGRFIAFNDPFNGISVVGGATLSPTTVAVPAAGTSATIAVSVAYPGLWLASSTTPWITLTAGTNGTASGPVAYTVAPNLGAARTGTFTVALQTVTVNQDAYVDVTPPTLTAPAPLTVYATGQTGATQALVPALTAFLNAATAVDETGTAPTALAPQLNGAPVVPATVFTIGTNTVTFSFRDAAGNVGTATSTVTVLAGRPTITVALVGTVDATSQQSVALRVTNTGAGSALDLNVSLTSLRTLAGTGTITLASGLPATVPVIAPGQSVDIPIVLDVPSTVTRFAISEALAMTDYLGAALSTTATQTVFPRDVTAPRITLGPLAVAGTFAITITWTTNEPATSRVDYGFGTTVNRTIPEDTVYTTSHSVTVSGLLPNTGYSYIVSGRDQAGNTYSSARRTIQTNP